MTLQPQSPWRSGSARGWEITRNFAAYTFQILLTGLFVWHGRWFVFGYALIYGWCQFLGIQLHGPFEEPIVFREMNPVWQVGICLLLLGLSFFWLQLAYLHRAIMRDLKEDEQ